MSKRGEQKLVKEIEDKALLDRLEKRGARREGAVANLIMTQLDEIEKTPEQWFLLEGVKSISYVRRIIVQKRKERLSSKGGIWVIKRIEGDCYAKCVPKAEAEELEEEE